MECTILLATSAMTSMLYFATWLLMKGNPWRWTKLAASTVNTIVFALIAHGIALNNKTEAYAAIATILVVEETITAAGNIVRQVYLRKRLQCLLSISPKGQA